ncbi:DUF1800 domain-containing protein [Spirosoma montaniterrae]|uniref:DUF1800 domain-containing protein n=1 Tax=Spirosoma montaniterrae TaxID=1178516 RepID=A0A1P9X2M3_9BACT|nr:DUF1800 domain-containing protein [Spirosoma montaniterrae]AQG81884.1 hypothetical protein AWR27_22845 [Spirosoma montaniterrae]
MNAVTSSLKTDTAKLRHLYSRAGFGATPDQLADAQSLKRAVRNLLSDSETVSELKVVEPDENVTKKNLKDLMQRGQLDRQMLRERIRDNAERVRDLNLQWLDRMASGKGSLREKMALFWHGHFACRTMGQNPLFMQQYINTIRQHALGRFGDLLMAVSKEPAMLQFLNNQQNRKNAPNENFAREVMELFTLGRGNYTERDIKEAARAFTGWQFTPDGQFVFREKVHDEADKTVFGKTGPFRGEDIVQMLLENRQTARFVTGKIYRFFVNETPDEARVSELADHFYKTNYDIAGLMERIFTADWFYDARNIGTHIKSPVELLAGMRHTLGITFDQPQPQIFVQRTLGQLLFYPPNVAGWPGGKNWIDSSSLLFRMQLPNYVLKAADVNIRPKEDGDVNTQSLARKGGQTFRTTVNWTDFEKPFAQTPDAALPDALAAVLLPFPLRPEQKTLVQNQLKSAQTHAARIHALTTAIMSLPEYQLA